MTDEARVFSFHRRRGTEDPERRVAAIALDNLGRYLRGEPLRNLAN